MPGFLQGLYLLCVFGLMTENTVEKSALVAYDFLKVAVLIPFCLRLLSDSNILSRHCSPTFIRHDTSAGSAQAHASRPDPFLSDNVS